MNKLSKEQADKIEREWQRKFGDVFTGQARHIFIEGYKSGVNSLVSEDALCPCHYDGEHWLIDKDCTIHIMPEDAYIALDSPVEDEDILSDNSLAAEAIREYVRIKKPHNGVVSSGKIIRWLEAGGLDQED